MFNLVSVLSTVLPIIAGSLLVVVFSISLYLNIRRKFPISVNCWFCNSWTKVPYDDRNSFDCPTCLQYNGFAKDGGYNKIIPEQRDELMNKSSGVKTNKTATSNGLCILCNNNQQLKIFQLANFVPLVEENYDVEIEHFQTQLEKAYKLCKKCDKVLKRTIDKQNAWIFGNHVKSLCKNGIAKFSNQLKKGTGLSVFAKVHGGLSVFLIFSVIFITLSSNKFFTKNLALYIPKAYLPIYKSAISAATTSKILELSFNPFFSKSVKIEPYFAICGVALVLQAVRVSQHTTTTKINQLLCWLILLLTSWVRVNKNYSTYILLIEAFCCIYLLSTAFSNDDTKKPAQKTTGKSMRKMVRNLEYTCSDVTDATDFENVSTSSNNCTSSRDSSDYLNKSYSTLDVPLQNHNFAAAGNVLNSSFVSAKTTCESDLNRSLNNLHLGGLSFKSPRSASSLASFALKRPKPVLSPPKFQTVNSWVAGGFWRDGEGLTMPVAPKTNLSRSSSESSGFGSQHNENTHFAPKSNYFVDLDKLSMNSEFLPHSPSPIGFAPPEFRRNTFYPNLQQNNMLLIQRGLGGSPLIKCLEPQRKGLFENWSDKINSQATQSFRDLSLRSNNVFQ